MNDISREISSTNNTLSCGLYKSTSDPSLSSNVRMWSSANPESFWNTPSTSTSSSDLGHGALQLSQLETFTAPNQPVLAQAQPPQPSIQNRPGRLENLAQALENEFTLGFSTTDTRNPPSRPRDQTIPRGNFKVASQSSSTFSAPECKLLVSLHVAAKTTTNRPRLLQTVWIPSRATFSYKGYDLSKRPSVPHLAFSFSSSASSRPSWPRRHIRSCLFNSKLKRKRKDPVFRIIRQVSILANKRLQIKIRSGPTFRIRFFSRVCWVRWVTTWLRPTSRCPVRSPHRKMAIFVLLPKMVTLQACRTIMLCHLRTPTPRHRMCLRI